MREWVLVPEQALDQELAVGELGGVPFIISNRPRLSPDLLLGIRTSAPETSRSRAITTPLFPISLPAVASEMKRSTA